MMCPSKSTALIAIVLVSLTGCRTLDEELPESAGMTQADFAVADADSDGKLTTTELATFLHREALAEIDLDNDSRISASEWAAARPSSGEEDPQFNALDRNGDGLVTEEEAVTYITSNAEFTGQFDELDGNDDNHLHWEEIDAATAGSLKVPLFPEKSGE